ncbi:MAG: hypothetical protein ACLTSZ_10885 [Lachnospiraceae bacterium]
MMCCLKVILRSAIPNQVDLTTHLTRVIHEYPMTECWHDTGMSIVFSIAMARQGRVNIGKNTSGEAGKKRLIKQSVQRTGVITDPFYLPTTHWKMRIIDGSSGSSGVLIMTWQAEGYHKQRSAV